MDKVLVVCGPTGVGKPKLSIALAKYYDGEIINVDSMFNLVRPFSHPFHCIEDRNIVSASNSIFRHPPEFSSSDKEQHLFHINGVLSSIIWN